MEEEVGAATAPSRYHQPSPRLPASLGERWESGGGVGGVLRMAVSSKVCHDCLASQVKHAMRD